MDDSEFIDLYEMLEISPNANSGTLERMFRYLAQRYHPDNPETGDRRRFDLVLDAHAVLKDPAKRAQYDIQYKKHDGLRSELLQEVNESNGIERDITIQSKLMSVLYVRRRQDVRNPGVPEFELERLFDCPIEHLEFHIWYLKAKGWIEKTDSGMFAITIDGIDHVTTEQYNKSVRRLLTDRSQTD